MNSRHNPHPSYEALLQQFEAESMAIAERGIHDAVEQKPIDAAEALIEQQAAYTAKAMEQAFVDTGMMIKHQIEDTKEQLKEVKSADTYKKELEQEKRALLKQAEKEIELAQSEAHLQMLLEKTGTVTGVDSALEEEIRQNKEYYNQIDTLYKDKLINTYKNKIPLATWLNRPWFFFVVVAFLALIEMNVNYTAFLIASLGDSNLIAFVLAFILSAFQAYSAKKLGATHYQKQQVIEADPLDESAIRQQDSYVKRWFLATLVLCLILSGSRFYMEEPFHIKLLYGLINLIIAGLTAYVGYRYAKHREFFIIQKERAQLAKTINHKLYLQQQIKEDLARKKEDIQLQIEKQAEQRAQEEVTRLKNTIKHLKEKLITLESMKKKGVGQLEQLKQNALERYRHLYRHAKTETPPKTVPSTRTDAKHNGKITRQGTILSFILTILFLGIGCTEAELSHTQVEVLFDRTDTITAFDVEPLVDFIVETADVDLNAGRWGSVTVNFSQIGEVSSQQVQTVHLPPTESYWARNEAKHKKIPGRFREELATQLRNIIQPGNGMKYSYIHRNYFYRLQNLSQVKGKRKVISFSDLILNEPELNFYHFRKQPHTIMTHQDSLVTIMTERYPLNDLKGVKLINIYQPSKENDALHEICKAYFGAYWEDQLGMEVEFRTNVPGQSISLTQHH